MPMLPSIFMSPDARPPVFPDPTPTDAPVCRGRVPIRPAQSWSRRNCWISSASSSPERDLDAGVRGDTSPSVDASYISSSWRSIVDVVGVVGDRLRRSVVAGIDSRRGRSAAATSMPRDLGAARRAAPPRPPGRASPRRSAAPAPRCRAPGSCHGVERVLEHRGHAGGYVDGVLQRTARSRPPRPTVTSTTGATVRVCGVANG